MLDNDSYHLLQWKISSALPHSINVGGFSEKGLKASKEFSSFEEKLSTHGAQIQQSAYYIRSFPFCGQ